MGISKYEGVGFFEKQWANPPKPFNPHFDPEAKERYRAVSLSMERDDYYAAHTRIQCAEEWRRRYEALKNKD